VDSPRLSQIDTRWSLLARAAVPADPAARDARAELLPQYLPAVHRYLSAAARDPTAADDLCQEFALRFVRGDFRHVRPDKGRFRDYLKTALSHLVERHRRPAGRPPPGHTADPAADPDRAFLDQWRRDVLARAWAELEAAGGDRPTLFDVLRRKADDPARTSAEVAESLATEFGRPVTAANVRQMLHRARGRFADALRRAAAAGIGTADPGEVEAELGDLGLLAYCR
jgi:RNA polymerase sigma-70 factor (ECF subfamily)